MVGCKVAIVGVGRMAALLASRIPGTCRKVIIGQKKAKAVTLADEVGGLASDQISAVRGCQVVFLAVPGSVVASVIEEAADHLAEGALVVNMAPEVPTGELASAFPRIRLAAAKVVGHVREMNMGSPGAVILDHVGDRDEDRLRALLCGLGTVLRADESYVVATHQAVVEVMVQAESSLRARLVERGLPREVVQAAITTLGPGVLRALSEDDAGPYLQEVIRAVRAAPAHADPAPHSH